MHRKLSFFLSLLLFTFIPIGCVKQETAYTKYSKTFFGTFDTVVTIIGYAKDQSVFDRVANEAEARFESLHQVYDAYNAYEGVNNVYRMNREAQKAPFLVEPELMDLLLYCKEKQPQMHGRVNIALGAVLTIWHEYRDMAASDPANAVPPPMELLTEAAAHVDFDALILDPLEGTVYYEDPRLLIDVGSVAKGYAVELVAQWMLTSEMPSFIISAGGNVRAGNPPEDGRARWGVGIQKPEDDMVAVLTPTYIDTIFCTNTSVVTSGDYQRYFVVDGEKYHHIIAPDTLMPGNFMRAITVVCEDSGMADLLSTMLFLVPYEDGLRFVESTDGVEAYWVLPDETIAFSSGMEKLLRSTGATSSDPV
jgi:thiamine biosynthesis lipoprotein